MIHQCKGERLGAVSACDVCELKPTVSLKITEDTGTEQNRDFVLYELNPWLT